MNRHRISQLVIAIVALHSITLGALNWLFTDQWMMALRMSIPDITFWPRQSGAFLISLGLGYGLGAFVPRYLRASTLIILFSKSVAVVFLFSEYLFRGASLSVLLAGLGDLSMLIVVGALTRWVYQRPANSD
ncbi:TPA: hypothetical protein EYP66_04490 [Candidatus Poribacteria bacterium]|nr:hypothetical protein [Candidatus Poribacteria bacterium]